MLDLENVGHSYPDGAGQITALAQIHLSVASGEFVAVMGPSGSGKTTLVNVASGLLLPEMGSVVVDGVELRHLSPKKRAQLRLRRIGLVQHDDELDPVLTAAENVALPLFLEGVPQRQARVAATEALGRCSAAVFAERYRNQLSRGQRQRVALARAIVGERALVLADEPTATLDTSTARGLVELLSSLASDGVAVLMTTHDSRLATFADRIFLIRDGRQVEAPSIPSLMSAP